MYEVPEPKKFAPEIAPEQLKAMQPIDKLVQYVVPRLIDKVNYLSWKVDKLEHEALERADILTAQMNCGNESFQQLQRAIRDIEGVKPVSSVPDDVLLAIQTLQRDVQALQMSPDSNGLDATVQDIYNSLNAIHEWQHAVDANVGKLMDIADKKTVVRRKKPVKPAEARAAAPVCIAEGSYSAYDPDKDEWVPLELEGVKVTATVVSAIESMEEGVDQWDYPEAVVKFVSNLSADQRAALCARFPE